MTTRRPDARRVLSTSLTETLSTNSRVSTATTAEGRRGPPPRPPRPTPPLSTCRLRRLFGRAEIAELLAGLLFPRRLERCRDPGAGGLARFTPATGVAGLTLRTITPRCARLAVAVTRATGVATVTIGRRIAVFAQERQRELAVLVDVVDAHRELVAEGQHVFDAIDALAPTELGDVDEPVATGKDVDERTELRDVHDPAFVDRAHLGGRRVEDQLDATLRLGNRGAVLRTDRDDAHAVGVGDRDVGAGLLLDRVDDLALRPDHLTDLVDRDLEADDLRCGVAHFLAGRRDRTLHDLEDLQAGVLGLEQRGSRARRRGCRRSSCRAATR